MYKIIGGDQKEYGPVTVEQLVGWIRDHRANAQTLVQKEGGAWVPLGSLPEFAEALGPSVPVPAPTPSPASGPAFGTTPPTSYPGSGGGAGGGFGGGPGGAGLGFGGPGGGGDARAREMVSGPAIGLLVLGILSVILSVIRLAGNFAGTPYQLPPGDIPPEMRDGFEQAFRMLEALKWPVAILDFAVSGLLIFASQKMRNLESFSLVVVATVLVLIPCFNCPICCLGLPIGIWILVVLFKPEVKSAFR